MCRPRSLLVAAARLAGMLALVAAAVALWPHQLGGPTSYLVVSGSSMEPDFSRGDLILLRQGDGYTAGDVIGFRDSRLGRTVLHRIVRVRPRGFTTKGDANDWIDPGQVERERVIGRAWGRVPAVGAAIAAVRRPLPAAALAGGLVLLLIALAARPVRRRWRRVRSRDPAGITAGSAGTVPLVAVGVGLALAVLAASAFSRPASHEAVEPGILRHSGAFSYSADAPPGAAYPLGSVQTGDAVFRRLVDRLEFSFVDRVTTTRRSELSGRTRLVAVLSDGQGWRREIALGESDRVVDGRIRVDGALELDRIDRLLTSLERSTGAASSTYEIDLRADVHVKGRVGAQSIDDRFAPSVPLRLDAVRIAPLPSEDGEVFAGGKVTRSVPGHQAVASRMRVGPLDATVSSMRMLGAVGAFGAILLAAALALRERRHGGEVDVIRVAERPVPSGVMVVPVSDPEEVARIGDSCDRPVLLCEKSGWRSYAVCDEGVWYECQLDPSGQPRGVAPAAPLAAAPGPPSAVSSTDARETQ